MPRTLLEIVNEQLATARLPVISTLVGTDSRARSLLALANKEIREQKRERFWPVLWSTATVNIVGGTDTYATPADFDMMVPSTLFPSSGVQIAGADTPAQWAGNQNFLNLVTYPHFVIRGRDKELVFNPEPSAADTYTYIYKSKYAVSDAANVAKEHFSADDDYPILDEELFELGFLWRYKHSLGMEYAEDFSTYDRAVNQRYAQEMVAPTIPIGNPTFDPLTDGYVPESGYGA